MTSRQRLWAPWRITYLSRNTPGLRCIFCAAIRSRADRKHHVVARGRRVFAILNRYPYNNGHLMIAPKRHIGTLAQIHPEEWTELLRMLQRFTRQLQRTLRPQGFNLGVNLGRIAGAGIPGHLHMHLVPRWKGDTNFMPVIAKTKVISQSLDALYTLLTRPTRRGAHAA